MKLALAARLAALSVFLALPGCAHVNPGQVVLSCAMDAAHDPRVIQAVVEAFSQPNWEAAIAKVVLELGPVGEEVVVCIAQSLIIHPQTGAGDSVQANARAFLGKRGYAVPR
jgi:hypothetical protein